MTHREQITDSSNIRAVAYDTCSSVLEVTFSSGDTYFYLDVPKHIYEELRTAQSKGKFHAQHIRDEFEGYKA